MNKITDVQGCNSFQIGNKNYAVCIFSLNINIYTVNSSETFVVEKNCKSIFGLYMVKHFVFIL